MIQMSDSSPTGARRAAGSTTPHSASTVVTAAASPPAEAARRSLTADIVSVARGVGVSPSLKDPLAIHFAGAQARPLLEAFEREGRLAHVLRRALRRVSLGLIDHNTLRMLLIDDLLRGWLARGCRQVVIVGAGMDSRCWRLEALSDASVFELDRAPTQALKRTRSAGLPKLCRDVRFVSIDFERDALDEPLAREGFRADQPAAWICEGVTPYLTVGSIVRLVEGIAASSAAGSKLALSYVAPSASAQGTRKGLAERLASRLGEPPRGLIAPGRMRYHVLDAGFASVDDLDWNQWIARVPAYRPVKNVFKEHLLIAERAARSPSPSQSTDTPHTAGPTES